MSRLKSVLDTSVTVAVLDAAVAVVVSVVSSALVSKDVPVAANSIQIDHLVALDERPVLKVGTPQKGLLIFTDFECPFCRKLELEVMPRVQRELVLNGRLMLAYRHLPLGRHQNAVPAAIASECAHEQDKFWPMATSLFRFSPRLDVTSLDAAAVEAGLDVVAYERCRNDLTSEALEADRGLAKRLGISGTPTLVIGGLRSDGTLHAQQILRGLQSYDAILAAVDGVGQERPQ
jgi:protein-disulfide isomerase